MDSGLGHRRSRASGSVQQARPKPRCLPFRFGFPSNDRIFVPRAGREAMQFPFGRRSHDLDQLRATLPRLGSSASVAGVAAALSWNERRVEKAVREWERLEPMRVAYNPLSRTVRLLGTPAPSPAPVVAGAAPVDTSPSNSPPPTAIPRAWTAVLNCRSCGSPMEPTGTGSGSFCPGCGRLSSGHSTIAPPPLPAAPATPSIPSGGPKVATSTGHEVSDRKAQEMFAAWATSRPIPCPRCRTALRHDGVGQYKCPGCGEAVRFAGHSANSAPVGPALAPPAA
jgi:predicted RNA-binding Zn-ribbon protein involved in translation (DUF1610 family)